MPDSTIIGKRLVTLRGERTQNEVAMAVGISTSTLGMYEIGKRIPKDHIKVSLARYFNTSVEEIFFRE